MEKYTQDKSELKTDNIRGDNPKEGKFSKESLNEEPLDVKGQPKSTINETPGGTIVGNSDKANIISSMNEDKSTISNTSSPSSSVSEK